MLCNILPTNSAAFWLFFFFLSPYTHNPSAFEQPDSATLFICTFALPLAFLLYLSALSFPCEGKHALRFPQHADITTATLQNFQKMSTSCCNPQSL